MYTVCVYSVCVHYVYSLCVYSVCTLRVQFVCTVCVYNTCTVCVKCVQYVYSVCVQYVYSVYCVSKMCVCTVCVHCVCVYTVCVWSGITTTHMVMFIACSRSKWCCWLNTLTLPPAASTRKSRHSQPQYGNRFPTTPSP